MKAGEKPDLDELSKAEIEALDAAIDKYKIWIPRLCLSYLMILPGMRHGIKS